MSTIFLSYYSKDRERVRPLAELLGTVAPVWWDPNIGHGERWPEVLQHALDGARCVVVAWTKHSVESDWVWNEANEGKKRGVLVPVLLDDVEPPLGFRHLQAAQLQHWQGSADDPEFEALLRSVRQKLDSPPEAVSGDIEAPPATPHPTPPQAQEAPRLPRWPKTEDETPKAGRKRRAPVMIWRHPWAIASYGAAGALLATLGITTLMDREGAHPPDHPISAVVVSTWASPEQPPEEKRFNYIVAENGNVTGMSRVPLGDTLRVALLHVEFKEGNAESQSYTNSQIEALVQLLASFVERYEVQVPDIRSNAELDPAMRDGISQEMLGIRGRVEQLVFYRREAK
ncbi:MAG TPA: toll/interleukin-1 receptor domain-containing protein [Longimicrobium sp.]|nr:toll/interleukin-1 receptor domain-containing protein [Longimicrobium sp.]